MYELKDGHEPGDAASTVSPLCFLCLSTFSLSFLFLSISDYHCCIFNLQNTAYYLFFTLSGTCCLFGSLYLSQSPCHRLSATGSQPPPRSLPSALNCGLRRLWSRRNACRSKAHQRLREEIHATTSRESRETRQGIGQ